MMQPDVEAFFDPDTSTVTYLVSDPVSGKAAIIDPVLNYTMRNARVATTSADKLIEVMKEKGLTLTYLLETHVHADHLSASHYLRGLTGAPILIGTLVTETQKFFAPMFEANDVTLDGRAFDRLLQDEERLPLGALEIRALHTPGHTPACMTYVVGNAAFIGDTLFMPDYGSARCDFPGGNARSLYRSVQRIFALPADTRLFTGHDYLPASRKEIAWESSVAQQRAENVHIRNGVREEEFVAMREARDKTLTPPQMILPALQVNIRAGAMPPPTPGGRVYLRLPVNTIK